MSGSPSVASSISAAITGLASDDAWLAQGSSDGTSNLDALQASLAQFQSGTGPAYDGEDAVDDDGFDEESEMAAGISALGPSLWQQLLDEAGELESQDADGDAIERHADEMEVSARVNPKMRLLHTDIPLRSFSQPEAQQQPTHPTAAKFTAYLATLDADFATSIRISAAELLADPHKNDDLAAAELAELLGFEQLDLVQDLVAHRKEVTRSLQGQQPDEDVPPSSTTTNGLTPAAARLKPTAKPYVPGAQMSVRSAQDIAESKSLRAAQRRAQKGKAAVSGNDPRGQMSLEEMERIRQEQLQGNVNRPLFSSSATTTAAPKYPHVFASGASGNVLSVFGSKFALPAGTSRADFKEYEEVTIPPPKAIPMRGEERLIPIGEMDAMCRGAFPGYKSLNRLQSVVYPLGYGSNENLLVCAPTGAGKTDVAMLTVLRAISQYAENQHAQGGRGYGIKLNDFKIIYVAPMKALAAEIVRKFSKRLAYLGVKVRELTGDMQMTRQEIAETQMIVTTPEKWDVVTRKPTGEGELASKVKLLIIDEVHLLHEDRGAVIETIVARTLRLVESSQSLIRIVGLSATLPNYVDVADFLRVNRYQGLFYFDSSFRPVPLQQHFLGIKGKHNSPAARANLDKAVFYKVESLLQQGHQVMIFVHARKETVKSALSVREMCRAEGVEDLLLAGREDKEGLVNQFKRDLSSSRNKELKELFESGLGIHHAGMLRSDRNLSERMFEAGVLKVLCCTSTLAWGVNLPAYAVLIKGTEVYDASLGKFVDLSILDVLQIFGRAGRPQYEDLGVGYICTPQEKLSHYIDAITSQHPIESKFDKGLVDSLNAECALGTVQNVQDGIAWLSYTYLFTRMRRNPMAYGMSHDEVVDDPHLGAKRLALITGAAKRLVLCKMLELDEPTGKMTITDLGRIAARYYIPWRTIEIFNERLRANMTEADVLNVLSKATDFEQIIPRDTEAKELKKMLERAPCEVPEGYETPAGKVNVLLQAYISRQFVEDFALASDTAYVSQNTGRIIRALFEISLSNKWSATTSALINMSKAVEKRMWPFDHPLMQSSLKQDTLHLVQRWADEVEVSELAHMAPNDIAQLVKGNERIGTAIRAAARQFPHLQLDYRLRPITADQLRIDVTVHRDFEWNDKTHGGVQFFYVWAEEQSGNTKRIHQWSRLAVRSATSASTLSFVLNLATPASDGIELKWISDAWIGSEGNMWVSFADLVLPDPPQPHLPLLELPLLPVASTLAHLSPEVSDVYAKRFLAFNAMQTQAFHTVMHTSSEMLLCGPVAGGKSTLAELSIWRSLHQDPSTRVLIIHPNPRILLQHAARFAEDFPHVRSRVAANGGELARADRSLREEVVFALPQHVLRALVASPDALNVFKLFIAEDVHMLSAQYEMALSRLRLLTTRPSGSQRCIVTSASLHDATSMRDWLGIKDLACYSFHPQNRSVPLRVSVQALDLPHTVALLKTMVKPVYDKARAALRTGRPRVLIFVPSRMQCSLTASDLVTRAASELDQQGFLGVPVEEIEAHLTMLEDPRLYEPLLHGISLYHDGLHPKDKALVMDLYSAGVIRVLVAPREAAWSLSSDKTQAGLVVVMSAQNIRIATRTVVQHSSNGTAEPVEVSERRVANYPKTDLLRMSAHCHGGECFVLCQTDQAEWVTETLQEGMPIESSLLEARGEGGLAIDDALIIMALREMAAGAITDVQTLMQQTFFSSFLLQRMQANPSYYDCATSSEDDVSERLSAAADDVLSALTTSGLVLQFPAQVDRPGSLELTLLAKKLLEVHSAGDDSALVTLIEMHSQASQDPILAAAFSRGAFAGAQKESGVSVGQAELVALRDRIPGEWLAAFDVPRADRKEKKARQQRQREGDGDGGGEGADVSAIADDGVVNSAPIPTPNLLLCAYFAGVRPDDGSDAVLAQQVELVRRVLQLRIRALR